MKLDRRQAFVNYKKSTAIPILCTDLIKWPIGSGRAGAKCHNELASEIVEDVSKILENKIDNRKMGALFVNPTRIFRMSHHILRSLKTVKTEKSEIQKIMTFFFDVLSTMKSGSVFNDDGYNIIMSHERIKQLIREREFYKPSMEESKDLHKLVGLLWTYSEALYFVAHEVCVEIHGLYRISNRSYLIRDYSNLSPSDLWSDVALLPYKKIRIVSEYKPTLDLEFDVYDNYYMKSGNLALDLESAFIEIDGKLVGSGSIQNLIEKAESVTYPIIEKVSKLSEIDQAKKYIEIFWYRKKPLRDILGKNWYPPKSIFERIDAEGIPPERGGTAQPESVYELLDIL